MGNIYHQDNPIESSATSQVHLSLPFKVFKTLQVIVSAESLKLFEEVIVLKTLSAQVITLTCEARAHCSY